MDTRANRVAEIINAPSTKHITAESRNHEDHGLIDERRHNAVEAKRIHLEQLHSKQNYASGLHLKPALRQVKQNYDMPHSPSKRPPTPTEEPSNEARAEVWNKIEENIAKYKKDTQLTYKQMLDEQLQQKQILAV